MPPPKLKEIFEIQSTFKSFYTGGDIQWSNDGKHILCECGGSIQFLNIETGLVEDFVGEEALPTEDHDVDLIVAFKLCPQDQNIVSAHKSGLLKLWDYEGKSLSKQWKSVHKGPVSKLAFTLNSEKLISGGSDSSIRIWDMKHFSCINNLNIIQGVCSVLKVYEDADDELSLIFAAGDNSVIKTWDLRQSKPHYSLEGHYSTVTDIAFSRHSKQIISCGRDKVLIIWELVSGEQVRVIPAYESLESVIALPRTVCLPGRDVKHKGGLYVATGGEKGVIRVWDVKAVKELYVQENSLVKQNPEGLSISRLLYSPSRSSFASISFDHNIFIHSVDTFACTHQFVGFFDEILDIAYVGEENSHLAVATNSPDLKLYSTGDMRCTFLPGHTGFVVTLAVSPANRNIFASASKDKSVRVWMVRGKAGGALCLASGMQHNSAVAGLALSQASLSFLLSGAEDNILKMWKIPGKLQETTGLESSCLVLKNSCVAHEKDINAIAVAPNDKFIATASLDKTAKLWSGEDLSPLGTFRGHRRGLWSVVFSPVDQVLLTASADTTLKIWSLSDLSCLKSLEGHESSVMRGVFLSRGLQVLSSSGDGLLKLWNIKTSECMATFEGHPGKIWALAVNSDESGLVTGCSGATLLTWRDVTEERKLEEAEKQRKKVQDEQKLFNLIQSKQYLEALRLALGLGRPATVLNIVQEVMKSDQKEAGGGGGGRTGLERTVLELSRPEQESLLDCAAHWNTNSRTAYPAQTLISILLPEIAGGRLKVSQSMVEVLIPYTERHFTRLTQLLQDLHLLDYTSLLLMQK